MVDAAETQALAADPQDTHAPRRALLLAGGGMRVAYQAGVLVALEETGLGFHHADGSSGGTINLAMLLSGITPDEACERWRTLRLRGFATLPSPRTLLRGPPYPALGSSSGLRRRVYPHLGIDPSRIQSARGIAGTFNVCDYAAKLVTPVPNEEVDLDVLIAAVSLPVLSPAVRHHGRILLDAAWIKDVNVAEAVRRGAEELWLVWCIGNHGVYRDGAFNQYVHMIEIAANGSLFAQLDDVTELNRTRPKPVRLHVIRPRVPLPLDPDFFLGRIDAATLIAMGYRDARAYLEDVPATGVPLDPSATRMEDPRPGVGLRESLIGEALGVPLALRIAWEIDDLAAFIADPEHRGTCVADVSHPRVGRRRLAYGGTFLVTGGRVDATLVIGSHRLELRRPITARGGARALLRDADGRVVADARLAQQGVPAWATLHARGVGSAAAGARTVASFSRWLWREAAGARRVEDRDKSGSL